MVIVGGAIKPRAFGLSLCPQNPAPDQTMEVEVAAATRPVMDGQGLHDLLLGPASSDQ